MDKNSKIRYARRVCNEINYTLIKMLICVCWFICSWFLWINFWRWKEKTNRIIVQSTKGRKKSLFCEFTLREKIESLWIKAQMCCILAHICLRCCVAYELLIQVTCCNRTIHFYRYFDEWQRNLTSQFRVHVRTTWFPTMALYGFILLYNVHRANNYVNNFLIPSFKMILASLHFVAFLRDNFANSTIQTVQMRSNFN